MPDRFVERSESEGIVTLTLAREKVNALNPDVVAEIRGALESAERDAGAVVLTGRGAFFSFGFDVPQIIGMSRDEFSRFATDFTALYTYMFTYPKPLVAAVNGHAIAGGCMLVLPCDHSVIAAGRAKIGLNEIAFGASLFAGSVEMLRFQAGDANASVIAYSGAMYSGEEAQSLGLVDAVVPEADVAAAATRAAAALAAKNPAAFAGIKNQLRAETAETMRRREAQSIRDFVDIWYSDAVRANLAKIQIH